MENALVNDTVKNTWKTDSAEEKWKTLKTVLVDAIVGFEKRKHSDWFRESVDVLEPLFQKRNQLYLRWLRSGLNSDKERFSKARRPKRLV